MKFAKKILPLLISSLLIFSINFSIWGDLPWGSGNPYIRKIDSQPPKVDETNPDKIHDGSATLSSRLKWIITVPQPEDYNTSLWYVMSLIQIAINRTLWILSFVTLVYMLYCGFLIFASGSEDNNAKKGKKWIKTAAIALAWIGLSWLIISAMIRLITILTQTKNS